MENITEQFSDQILLKKYCIFNYNLLNWKQFLIFLLSTNYTSVLYKIILVLLELRLSKDLIINDCWSPMNIVIIQLLKYPEFTILIFKRNKNKLLYFVKEI